MLTMLMVNIADAKAKLSEYVEAVARGEVVIICNRNKPVAELRAVEQARTDPRDLSPMHPRPAGLPSDVARPRVHARCVLRADVGRGARRVVRSADVPGEGGRNARDLR